MPPRKPPMTTWPRCRRMAAAVLLAGAAGGCTSLGDRPGQLAVASDPAGAEVHVMGAPIGVTPLLVDHRRLFPATFAPQEQARYGAVEVHKAGCRSVMRKVSAGDLARGLDVKLDCGPGGGPAAAAAPPAPPPPATAAPRATPANGAAAIEARLRRVQELRERGVISEAEAQAQRRRILDEL